MSLRLPDWRQRLSAIVAERRHVGRVWGVSDCCLTSADIVAAMTGQDFAAPLRGYTTEQGARLKLKRLGFASVTAFVDSILPRTTRARAGDFILVPQLPLLDAAMICDGYGAAWYQDENGLERIAIPAPFIAWEV